jgi:hypothetical protein
MKPGAGDSIAFILNRPLTSVARPGRLAGMFDATRVVRAGLPPARQGEPFLPGPVFAAPYHLSGDPAGVPYTYGRFQNPTWTHFENAVGEIEGGSVRCPDSNIAPLICIGTDSPGNGGINCSVAETVTSYIGLYKTDIKKIKNYHNSITSRSAFGNT